MAPTMNYVFVPMAIQAFTVSEDFNKSAYRVAPLIQPDFGGLRQEEHGSAVLGHDVMDQLDLSEESLLAASNTRFVDVATGQVMGNRAGVYLSWCLPKGYRTGITSTTPSTRSAEAKAMAATDHAKTRAEKGYPASGTSDASVIEFRPVPDRWLVFRFPTARWLPGKENEEPPLTENELWDRSGQFWIDFDLTPEVYVVESNRVRSLDDADLQDDGLLGPVDLANLVSPFIDPTLSLNQQYETYLGFQERLRDYKPSQGARYKSPLTVVESANELFPDYQPHNQGVFSLFDNMDNNDRRAVGVKGGSFSYLVVGFHAEAEQDPLAPSDADTTNERILESMSIKIADEKHENPTPRGEMLLRDAFLTSPPLRDQNLARIICHGSIQGVCWRRDQDMLRVRSEEDDPSGFLQSLTRFTPSAQMNLEAEWYVYLQTRIWREPPGPPPKRTGPALVQAELEGRPSIGLQTLVRESHPVSVGTHTLDALLAYLRVANPLDTPGIDDMVSQLAALEPLILADDGDDVTSQLKAADKKSAVTDFFHVTGGSLWRFGPSQNKNTKGSTSKGTVWSPTPQLVRLLHKLNEFQSKRDAARRELDHMRRRLWFEWWKCVTDAKYRDLLGGTSISDIKDRIRTIEEGTKETLIGVIGPEIGALGLPEASQTALLTALSNVENHGSTDDSDPDGIAFQQSPAPPFLRPVDPTVLFAGIPSGWPKDYGDVTTGRLLHQVIGSSNPAWRDNKIFPDMDATIRNAFPDQHEAIQALVAEWAHVHGNKFYDNPTLVEMSPARSMDEDRIPPMYDEALLAEEGTGKYKCWRPQGWFPLFIEWEVEYYHVPWRCWSFEKGADGIFAYQIDKTIILADQDVQADCRVLSGRAAISPQASMTLRTRVRQLLQKLTPEELDDHFPSPADVQALLQKAINLEYFSAALDGLQDHLATQVRGTQHLGAAPSRASNHSSDDGANPLEFHDLHVNILAADLAAISAAGVDDAAPYGSQVTPSARLTGFSPFKPVTHGQARFTKLTIVDKFGQIVTCIDPPMAEDGSHYVLYPCTSPAVSVAPVDGQLLSDRNLSRFDELPIGAAPEGPVREGPVPNTVIDADQDAGGLCQFFQLPPRINHEARINMLPLVFEPGTKDLAPHRPRSAIDGWENPIWGWIVLNFPDMSLRTYTGDGHFIAQLSLLPDGEPPIRDEFPLSKNSSSDSAGLPLGNRITALTDQLAADASLCTTLFHLLNRALDSTTSTPASYPESCLPSALGRPFALLDFGFSLELATPPRQNESILDPRPPDQALVDYAFPYHLGDADAAFDGLIAYTPDVILPPTATSSAGRVVTKLLSEFALVNSDDTGNGGGGSSIIMHPDDDAKPTLSPFYLPSDTDERAAALIEKMVTVSAIVDPFVPVHLYTGGLLPPAPLEIPRWAVEQAMGRMGAAVRVGPMVLPALPDLASDKQPSVQIPVPSGKQHGEAKWEWAMPLAAEGEDDGEDQETKWTMCAVEAVQKGIKIDKGGAPVLVEGWMVNNPETGKETSN